MSFSTLSHESLLSYYESIRKEVEADRELRRRGHRHFLTNSDALKNMRRACGRRWTDDIELFADRLVVARHRELPNGTSELCNTGKHKRAATPLRASRLLRLNKGYLVSFFIPSFDMSPFMLSSDFVLFFVLEVFFILALASIGLSVFMESWAAGPVVWPEATDMLPTRAAQHAAISRFRILVSCWNKRPKQ